MLIYGAPARDHPRFGFQMVAGDEFKGYKAGAGAEGAAGGEEPEGGGGHRLVEAADPADERGGGGRNAKVLKGDKGGVLIFSSVGERGASESQSSVRSPC